MIFVTRLLRNPAQMADFCAIFLHKTGFLCKFLSESFTFWSCLTRNFGAGTRNSEPRNSFFGARNFYFGARTEKSRYRNFFTAVSRPGSYGKIPVQKRFRGGSGGVFLSRWNFFPDTFPVSFCRRNPPAGFPSGRVSAPGVSRVPSKRQVWRGFRDILISAWRVWLRFFLAVPARRPNTRISEGENEQIVNAHPKVTFCQYRRCGIPAAQSQDRPPTYAIVRVCAARMLHLLFCAWDLQTVRCDGFPNPAQLGCGFSNPQARKGFTHVKRSPNMTVELFFSD